MTVATKYPSRRWLFVSDIDDTLTGDPRGMVALGAVVTAQRDRLWFAVNSSRPSGSVARTLAEDFPDTLKPDAVITALGTEIALEGRPLAAWQARFSGWPRNGVFETLASLGHRPHDEAFQTALKVSFAVPQDAQGDARAALQATGIPCITIASGRDDFDVIPLGAGKDSALNFLAQTLGISRENTVVAGDSGNDLAMFHAAGKAIAVGNARAELLAAMPAATSFHATKPHALGVLEGLIHFGVLCA